MAQGAQQAGSQTPHQKKLGGLHWYRVAAHITGVLLLLLAVEIIAKYAFGQELEMAGPQGFLAFVPNDTVEAINLSRATVIAHGWFYVVFLFTCFRIWSMLNWPLWRFLWLASAGLVPGFSYVLEHYGTKAIRREIAAAETVS